MAVVYSVKMAIPGFVVSHKSMSPMCVVWDKAIIMFQKVDTWFLFFPSNEMIVRKSITLLNLPLPF